MTGVYEFNVEKLEGGTQDFADYKGKVLLIVNTASKCGFTPQFEGLEQLHKAYAQKGLVVIGFPCNQFANQDPGSNSEIGEFCQRNYGVSFAMMAKINVRGADIHPLYKYLTSEAKGFLGEGIKWNFTKFLVGKDGQIIKRYAPTTKPSKIAKDIAQALDS